MPSTRYTILLADRQTGVVRRFTVGLRPTLIVITTVVTLPVLIGMGAAWKSKADVADLFASHATLELELANYRVATEALTGQLQGLQTALDDLGGRAALDPALRSAMDKLPAIVKSRAMGGGSGSPGLAMLPGLNSPEDTFGLLRDLLQGLESRLESVQSGVDKRNLLAAATPSLWPVAGWLTSAMGNRRDPFTGDPDFHPGLDISADRGSPVYATADGVVVHASPSSNYGNLIRIDHGFGLESRYGHLSKFEVEAGTKVKRGDLIGRVGATGRATAPHLHYEVRVNDRLLNPLQFLLKSARQTGGD
ncbi:MAG TPA: M23 family metallopeptidase [Vicinamibacterales bacterium]|nr:M23 family metallopeptidase [Vicinamibacterales bacterium]